jgi:hypothetical protein
MCCSFLGQELAVSAAMGGGRSYILSTIHELYQERSPMAIMGPHGSCVQHHPKGGGSTILRFWDMPKSRCSWFFLDMDEHG